MASASAEGFFGTKWPLTPNERFRDSRGISGRWGRAIAMASKIDLVHAYKKWKNIVGAWIADWTGLMRQGN